MRHLKLADKDKADLIQQLLEFIKHDASLKHKLVAIRDILDHAPKKQEFIMVGDSGELDPEVRVYIQKQLWLRECPYLDLRSDSSRLSN